MKNIILKSKLLGLLVVAAVITITSTYAVAVDVSASKEVLTTLEQRMQKRITVDFRSTPIDDVLRIMAEQADVDIVKSPKVDGNVTASLTDVPLQEALNNILTAHGYGFVLSKNMIRVSPIGEIADENIERLVNKIYRITYADVKEVETALKKFISKRGYISSNPGTSNIIITDIESKIKAIDTFVGEIDRITPQILVEARIYDITSKDRLDLGIQWNVGRNTTYTGGLAGIGTNPADRIDPFITGGFTGAVDKAQEATGSLRFGWLNGSIDMDVLLKAEKEAVQAKLLANPRILVLDNEQAQFKIVSEIPYQELSESTFGGTVGQTKFREVGVDLVVTPHLTRDGMIKLQLQPKFSIRADDETLGSGDGTFSVPVVDRREASTVLLVKDSQTVVLGGLRKKDVVKQVNKVPLLGDLPLVGGLFRFKGEDTVVSELVVFVTPHVIEIPVMTETERKAYEETTFDGPEVTYTDVEESDE